MALSIFVTAEITDKPCLIPIMPPLRLWELDKAFLCLSFSVLIAIAALEKAASRLGATNRDSLVYTPRANEDSLGMGLPYCAGKWWSRLHGKLIIPVMRDLVFACLVLQRWNEEGSYLDYLHP